VNWPHDEAARLLDEWARLPDGPAKQMAQDAYFACLKRLAALQEALLRATVAEGGPGDCLRVLFGDDIAHALEHRFALWQKVADELVRRGDRLDHENRRLWSKVDKLEQRVRELEGNRPALKVASG
jgi:hypothetical protein